MLPLVSIPDIIEHYAPKFEDLFTLGGYDNFQRYISGLLISENKTVEGINRLFSIATKNQSSLNRFLNKSPYSEEALNTRRLEMLQSNASTRFKSKGKHLGSLSIDDTLLEHYGKSIDGIYMIWDHNKHCYVRAHNLLTLHYSDDKCDYPVYDKLWEYADLEALEQKMDELDIYINATKRANKKEKTKGVKNWRQYLLSRYSIKQHKHPELQDVYKTKIHLAQDMLSEFCKNYPSIKLPVSFDSWFTTPAFCKYISQTLKRDYVGAIKSKETLILAGSKQKTIAEFTAELVAEHRITKKVFQKTKIRYKGKTEYYYTYCKSHRVKNFEQKQRLLISFNDDPINFKADELVKKTSQARLFISNQLKWHASGICRIYRHRWPVEVYHEEGKAEGLDKYQLRNLKAIKRHIGLVVLVYSILQCARNDLSLLNKLQKKISNIKDYLNGSLPYMRRLTQAQAFHALIQWIFLQVKDEVPLALVLKPLIKSIAYT